MKLCRNKLHYYEGKQCPECHKTWLATNRERIKAEKAVYDKAYRAKNADKLKKNKLQWQKDNKEARRKINKRWGDKNKHKKAHYCAMRRARLIQATPKWLTPEQLRNIEVYYEFSTGLNSMANGGEKVHVDHIVPLKGKNVCGLHVPWNLQIVGAEYNSSKGNKT